MRPLKLAVHSDVRRREVIKYVGDKKSAHVSGKRKHHCEQALDRVWSILNLNICNEQGETHRLNQVYLEILAVIEALTKKSFNPVLYGHP